MFSHIPERRQWNAVYPGGINHTRKWINKAIEDWIIGLGGNIVAHPHLKWSDPSLYLRDEIHFSRKGNDIFLNDIRATLEAAIQRR